MKHCHDHCLSFAIFITTPKSCKQGKVGAQYFVSKSALLFPVDLPSVKQWMTEKRPNRGSGECWKRGKGRKLWLLLQYIVCHSLPHLSFLLSGISCIRHLFKIFFFFSLLCYSSVQAFPVHFSTLFPTVSTNVLFCIGPVLNMNEVLMHKNILNGCSNLVLL